jgi:hypothetical protein
MSRRQHEIMVRLSDAEFARLDELRADEERAVYLRRLVHEPPKGTELATHGEAMAILSRLARDGKGGGRRRLEAGAPGRSTGIGA